MANRITVDWDSTGEEWDSLNASLSALMEYDNAPEVKLAFSVKSGVTLAAVKEMLAIAKAHQSDCKLKLVATFSEGKQLRLFGPAASEALATSQDIEDFLRGSGETE